MSTRRTAARENNTAFFVFSILIFTASLFVGCNGKKGKDGKGDPPAVPVTTQAAVTGDLPVYLRGLGSVTPLTTVTVKSRVDGALEKILYQEGKTVHEGDLLAVIDPRPYKALLAQVEGQLQRDKSQLQNAQLDVNRYQDLILKAAVPRQQLDTQKSLVRQFEGTVAYDQGQVDNAKLQLSYCNITAPLTGRVGLRLVDQGNIVHASDATGLMVITQLQPVSVVFSLAEDYLPQVLERLHSNEPLAVDAYDRALQKKIATGTLLTIDNQIDSTTGTVKFKAVFPNDDTMLFPNQFINVKLLIRTERGATMVPNAAIQKNLQGTYVYVIGDDQTASIRPVKVVAADDEKSAVTGIDANAVVAIDGLDKLQQGTKVSVQKPQDSKQNQTK